MSRYYEPYPFDDEPSTRMEWKRNWREMPPRHEWNADPSRNTFPICTSCGYRWNDWEMQDRRCWNCYMIETNPGYIQRLWEGVDRNNSPAAKATKKPSRLMSMGEDQ